MLPNYLMQDLVGISLAFLLYFLVFLFPGHVIGWAFDLLDFRRRTPLVQGLLGMTFSSVVSPTLFYFVYRFLSADMAVVLSLVLAVFALAIFVFENRWQKPWSAAGDLPKAAVIFTLAWLVLCALVLADLQIGDRLYFSNNAYDLTTRVAVVDAITRTGVPPVNPSFYPGHEVRLNFLYYFWYILASLVEKMGGDWVTPQHAMIASVGWAGLLLFATMAVYIRMRGGISSSQVWKKSFIAIQLFAVSGLDFMMVMMIASAFDYRLGELPFKGNVEGWNMPIMSWMNALAWVPHHLTATLACMVALIFLFRGMNEKSGRGWVYSSLVGIAFSSALGLSFWVMFIFGIFWIILGMTVLLRRDILLLARMIVSGLVGVFFAFPFLAGILSSGGGAESGGAPLAFYVRPFIVGDLLDGLPQLNIDLINLVSLPLNYFFEFGFFFVLAVIWLRNIYSRQERNFIQTAEITLVVVSLAALSFLRSNLIAINDFGIRGWLPMQFILVVWSADVVFQFFFVRRWVTPNIFLSSGRSRFFLMALPVLFIIGWLTTGLELFSLRAWSMLVDAGYVGTPNELSPDLHLGERTFAARQAYDFIRENLPQTALIQSNPADFLDRPSGLYASRPMVISDRSPYGVPLNIFDGMVEGVSRIFLQPATDWEATDVICKEYSIEFLVIKESDALWGSLPGLNEMRQPLYENRYYAVYSCGD